MDLDSAKQIAPIVFSDSYLEARQKFLTAAQTSRAYRSSADGPSGEALFTDVTYFGHSKAKNLLVLISATHGVEGYCGSAGQLVFLRSRLHEGLPPSTAVLIIHALNSYGFAWDRRVTVEGCDLNRNFVDFSKPLPPNPGYEELAEHIVPADISEHGIERAEAAIAAYKSIHGELSFQQALVGGQYTRPGGMFYGGTEPTKTRRTLEQISADFDVAAREQVIIVDYHTGLGRYGYGELQCEQPSGVDGYDRAVKIFGPSVTSPEVGNSSSVVIPGSIDAFWERALGDRHTYIALEFGTYTGKSVLRKDHWLFAYRPEEADSEHGREIRRASKSNFYPQMPDWNEMIVWRSHQVHRQALEALT
ncbi:DUF2817 domain-containing protein [Mesorhizobium sp. B4-1-4]|uniref:DUF2817 domain-containing protein n=1 Tax=Mesorhizobium sp. B4-1-4 TaxID=2589888 RepID=UPI0011273881|nr:DUF2817 domain-containing protein [Mesorhizobium sp. B4-1-4]UCI31811.1 M14 family metallopeptidase [Mesorhizobium sp. B4-1-4]